MTIPAHHQPRGGFRNPWPDSAVAGYAPLFRWWAERHTVRRPRPDPDPSVFRLHTPRLDQVQVAGELALTWIGHSTVLLQFHGFTALTDPVWSQYPSPLPVPALRRWVAPPLALAALPRIDLFLISHNHYDHLDAPTVRQLARLHPEAAWCTPLGVGPLLKRLGARNVHEFDWWQEMRIGPARIGATPAQHFSARGVHDRNSTLWSGFSIQVDQRSVYFAGDTGYHPEFGAIADRLGPFDALLLPVGAYEPRWFMRPMHMSPEDALLAYGDMGQAGVGPHRRTAPVMVPIHWGTFKLTDEPMDEPPMRTRAAWRAAGYPESGLWLLRHGETRMLDHGGEGRTPAGESSALDVRA